MKKKILQIFFPLLLLVPFPVYAEEQTAEAGQQIAASDMSDILVSFLYLAAVLALIYVVLLLIDRYAKKHNIHQEQDKAHQEEKTQEEDAADGAPSQTTENDKSANEDKKSNE